MHPSNLRSQLNLETEIFLEPSLPIAAGMLCPSQTHCGASKPLIPCSFLSWFTHTEGDTCKCAHTHMPHQRQRERDFCPKPSGSLPTHTCLRARAFTLPSPTPEDPPQNLCPQLLPSCLRARLQVPREEEVAAGWGCEPATQQSLGRVAHELSDQVGWHSNLIACCGLGTWPPTINVI